MHGARVPARGRRHQGGRSRSVLRVDVRLLRNEQPHGFHIAAPGGRHQRTSARLRSPDSGSPSFEQKPRIELALPADAALIKGRPSIRLALIHAAPRSSSSRTLASSEWPSADGVEARLFFAFTSAPLSSRSFMVASEPNPAAWCRGVEPACPVRSHPAFGCEGLLDVARRPAATAGDERRQAVGSTGFGGASFLNLHPEVGALVDPGAEEVDFFARKGAGGRHLHAAVAIDDAA